MNRKLPPKSTDPSMRRYWETKSERNDQEAWSETGVHYRQHIPDFPLKKYTFIKSELRIKKQNYQMIPSNETYIN